VTGESYRFLCITSTGFWKPAKTRDFLKHADAVAVDAVKVQIHPWLEWATGESSRNWLAVMKSTIQVRGLYPNNLPAPPNPMLSPSLLGEVRVKLEEIFGVACTH
jgi:hypothetical protein